MTLVLDASMAIAWLFEDEETDAIDHVMQQVIDTGAIVPVIWRLEVANVLHNAMRRKRCDRAYVDHSLNRLARFPITTDNDTNVHAWGSILTFARERNLTLYDASYLELALRIKVPLASCDGALLNAAKSYGLETFSNLAKT